MTDLPGGDGQSLLRAVKRSAGPGGPQLVLPVGLPATALLRPVATQRDHLDQPDVALLTDWRNRHVSAFLTEFEATEERTANWLVTVVGPDDTKVLFMVDDAATGATLGYMGLAAIDWSERSVEADAIVRGSDGHPGLMKAALQVLLQWARHQLGLVHQGVRVRSDNSALAFYERVGFVERRRVPLRLTVTGAERAWVEDPAAPGDLALVHLSYQG